ARPPRRLHSDRRAGVRDHTHARLPERADDGALAEVLGGEVVRPAAGRDDPRETEASVQRRETPLDALMEILDQRIDRIARGRRRRGQERSARYEDRRERKL